MGIMLSPNELLVLYLIHKGRYSPRRVANIAKIGEDEARLILDKMLSYGYAIAEKRSFLFVSRVSYKLTDMGVSSLRQAEYSLSSVVDSIKRASESRDGNELARIMKENREWLPFMLTAGLVGGIALKESLTSSYLPDIDPHYLSIIEAGLEESEEMVDEESSDSDDEDD
ncbi:MAG: hypothetical protein NXY59_07205 [Aigarchaeota archaeon]|nr:hypothetical protein [Candidatus Pelearchaeum maunauluense]